MSKLNEEELELIYNLIDCRYEDDEEKEYKCNNCKFTIECLENADLQDEFSGYNDGFYDSLPDGFWDEID